MSVQLNSIRRWVPFVFGVLLAVTTLMVALNLPGQNTYLATSSLLVTLESPVVDVDEAVDRLESADTSDALGTLLQVLGDPELHLRAMESVGIGTGGVDGFEVTVTRPADALMVTVEVAGPGPEVVDVAGEIGTMGSVLAEGSFPGLDLAIRQSLSATDSGSATYRLLGIGVGILAALVIVGGAFVEREGANRVAGGIKAVLRNWIAGEAVPIHGWFVPWSIVVGTVLALVLLVALGQSVWLALGATVGLLMPLALRFPQLLAIGLVVLVAFNLSDIGTDYFGLPGTSVPYTLFVFLVLAIRTWVLDEDRRGWIGLAVAIGALAAVMSVSGLTADDQALAFEWTIDLVKNGLVAVLMVVLIRNIGDLRRVIWVLIVSTSLLSLLGIIRNLIGEVPGLVDGFAQVVNEVVDEEVVGSRIAGPIGDANFFGQFLVVMFPFAFERGFRERSLAPRLISIVASLLIASAVVLTYSRGAFIGLVVVTAVTLALIRPALRSVLVVTFVVALVMFLMPSQYLERIGSLGQVLQIGSGTGIEDAALRGRLGENLVGLEMFHDHPISGVGPGNYPGRYVEYSSELGIDYRLELRQPHSLPIEVAAELGVLGLAWWSIAAFILGSRLLRARRLALRAGDNEIKHSLETICVSFVGFAATALFLHLAFARSFWMMVGIAVAAIRVANADVNRTAPVAEYSAT
jgi:O-antigen ligase